jgi:pyruvate kinase
VTSDDAHDVDEMVGLASKIAFMEGVATPGDKIIITAGVPFGVPGSTNMLRIAEIGPDGLGK